MQTLSQMGLIKWDLSADPYDHVQLASNIQKINDHDHTTGKGNQVPTGGIVDHAVTNVKLATNAVATTNIQDASVTKVKLASDAIGDKIGDVKMVIWPGNAGTYTPPDTWVVLEGQTLTSSNHDFPTGGASITLPDCRRCVPMGSALSGTGSLTSQPPGMGSVGGSHTLDLRHVHTVNSHTHTVASHSHTVNAHSHSVSSHTHTIQTDGAHDHGFLGLGGPGPHVTSPNALGTRAAATSSGSTFQALYLPGYNTGNSSTAFLDMEDAGLHGHGGATGAAAPGTDSQSPGTNSVGLTTDATSPGTGNPTADFSAIDSRNRYVGVLYIYKVKN
jgi:hypothetical protein